jgi:hypothetical protein
MGAFDPLAGARLFTLALVRLLKRPPALCSATATPHRSCSSLGAVAAYRREGDVPVCVPRSLTASNQRPSREFECCSQELGKKRHQGARHHHPDLGVRLSGTRRRGPRPSPAGRSLAVTKSGPWVRFVADRPSRPLRPRLPVSVWPAWRPRRPPRFRLRPGPRGLRVHHGAPSDASRAKRRRCAAGQRLRKHLGIIVP